MNTVVQLAPKLKHLASATFKNKNAVNMMTVDARNMASFYEFKAKTLDGIEVTKVNLRVFLRIDSEVDPLSL